jgi:hypothetical protein
MNPGATRATNGRQLGAGRLLALTVGLLLLAGAATPAEAVEGSTQTLIFVGTTRFQSDDATSYGTTFGGSFGYEIIDNLLWSAGIAVTTTDGTATVNNKTYDIYARSTTLQTGPTYYFNRSPGSLVIPYIGAGVSLLNYDVEYEFPGSDLGKTSGTGPGGYALAGVELWMSRSITLVLQYTLAAHEVKTQDGDRVTLRSGGLGLSLRIGIRI